jgi:hypothetical protein
VVLFNCGTGLKYPMPPADRVLATPVDWDRLRADAAQDRP